MMKTWTFLSSLLLPSLAAGASTPNIIFVLVDDMGWGDLGFYHEQTDLPRIDTPHLQAMAQQGVQLRRHYSAAPVSAPARASLFTGKHQGHAQVVRNSNFDAALEDSHTFASVLQAAGYDTALIGKWGIAGGAEHSGSPSSAAWPTKRGFDYFFGYANHIAAHSHYPKENKSFDAEQGCNAIWDGDKVITSQLDCCYSTDLFTARAKKWIVDQQAAHSDKPFLLCLTLTAPHARLGIPSMSYPAGGGLHGGIQWLGKAGQMINTSSGQRDAFIYPQYRENQSWVDYAQSYYPAQWQQALSAAQRHATMVSRIDEAMGDLMRLCADLKIDENTIIIFTSDNGAHNERGAIPSTEGHPSLSQDPSFFRSYGRSDGIKRDMWDGGLRVPCIIYAPKLAASGLVLQEPCQFHDWLASLADIAQLPCPASCDGRSLWPMIQGKADGNAGLVYSEFSVNLMMPQYRGFASNKTSRLRGEQQMLYFTAADGRQLKAIRTQMKTGREDFEIYDTLQDEHESQNLAAQFSAEEQEGLKAKALRSRRIYDYARDPKAGSRTSGMTGHRVYDKLKVPSLAATGGDVGLRMRRVHMSCPWVPKMDSLAPTSNAQQIDAVSKQSFPESSVTDLEGLIQIPESDVDWHFYLRTTGKAFVRLHEMQLIDADKNYQAGQLAHSGSAHQTDERDDAKSNKKGIPLESGLHAIRITVMQAQGQGEGKLELFWQRGEGEMEPIPDDAFRLKP